MSANSQHIFVHPKIKFQLAATACKPPESNDSIRVPDAHANSAHAS